MSEDIFNRLLYLAKYMTSTEIEEFESLLAQYVKRKDEKTLDKLLYLFNDETPFHDAIYSLLHLIETWPDEVYVREVLKSISKMLKLSPTWLKTIAYGIFNHSNCLLFFRQNMHLAPKEDLLKLFDLMEKDSPLHKKLIEELRREIEQK